MAIIDIFPYFNEKEIMELRIRLLHDYVDKFIIIESNKTHSGLSKPFNCINTLESLGFLDEKISVIELEMPSFEEQPDPWFRERTQRDIASDYISESDVCVISDCDEIINPDFLDYYVGVAKNNLDNILRIPLYFLCGKADLRVYDNTNKPVTWMAPFICMKHHLQNHTLSQIRESYALNKNDIKYSDIFITEDGIIKEAGWHFSWMGPRERLEAKRESFLHHDEVALKKDYSPTEGSTDPLGRKEFVLKKFPHELLPSLMFQYEGIKNFLLPDENL